MRIRGKKKNSSAYYIKLRAFNQRTESFPARLSAADAKDESRFSGCYGQAEKRQKSSLLAFSHKKLTMYNLAQ